MNLLNQIQSRIGRLKEMEKSAREAIENIHPAEMIGNSWNFIYDVILRRRELENILKNAEPDQPKYEKFVPFTGLKERTPEENEKYHEELIENGLRGICGARNMATRKYFMKLQQYFVNVTSLVWCAGLIEKLEEVEVILQQSIGEEENIIETQLKEFVSKQLHEAYSQLGGLTDNCNILEKELNLNE
jgi:hypothetical protein